MTIIRDRVQDMVNKGMTLEQVKAAKPTRIMIVVTAQTTGIWTTDMFVEAVYKSLGARKIEVRADWRASSDLYIGSAYGRAIMKHILSFYWL